MNIKVMRNIHLYLGCFFAPLLILFIITGSWQMYDKHRDAKDGSYHAPAVVKALSNVHMEQSVGDHRSGAKSSEPFKYLIVLMGFGLLVTTILGVVMAFKYVAPRIVWLCLVLGIIIPLILLWCGGAFAVEPPIASDIVDQIRSYVNIDFKQEDAIKPIVEDYATAFKLLQDKFGSQPKVFFVQIVKINQDLDVRLSQILTYDQMRIWKQNKRQILPEVRNSSY